MVFWPNCKEVGLKQLSELKAAFVNVKLLFVILIFGSNYFL